MLRNNPLHDMSHNTIRHLKKKLKKLTYFYIMIILFKLLFGDLSSLMMDIFLILMLYCLFSNTNHTFIAWVIVSIIMNGFNVLIVLLFFIQDIYLGFFITTPIVTIYIMILISQIILFILLINNCFLLYKESRALFRTMLGQSM
jgi:hypothetical protein